MLQTDPGVAANTAAFVVPKAIELIPKAWLDAARDSIGLPKPVVARVKKGIADYLRGVADTFDPPKTASPLRSDPGFSNANRAMLDAIESAFEVREQQSVREILSRFPYLLPLLNEMPVRIAEVFGNGTPFSLDASSYSTHDGYDTLVVSIRTQQAPEDAIAHLDVLYETWWLDRMPDGHGKVTIMLEYA